MSDEHVLLHHHYQQQQQQQQQQLISSSMDISLRSVCSSLRAMGLINIDEASAMDAFTSIIESDGNEDLSNGASVLSGATMRILMQQQSYSRDINELEAEVHRLRSDAARSTHTIARLNDQCALLEREVTSLQLGEGKLQKTLKESKAAQSSLRAELQKIRLNSLQRESQYRHEVKKKEVEYDKLKSRLQQLVSHRAKDLKMGLEVINSAKNDKNGRVRRIGVIASTVIPGNEQEDMYAIIVSNYEERQKELMVENEDLRTCLKGMQTQLVQLLGIAGLFDCVDDPNGGSNSCSDDNEDIKEDDTATASLTDGRFDLPFDMAREGIEEGMREKCRLLGDAIFRLRSQSNSTSETIPTSDSRESTVTEPSNAVHDEEVMEMRRQLADYRNIIEAYIDTPTEPVASSVGSLNDSHVAEEWAALEYEMGRLQRERTAFEVERLAFTEAAKQLGRERGALAEERRRAEQDRLAVVPAIQDLLRCTPFRTPRIDGSPDGVTARKSRGHEERTPLAVITPGGNVHLNLPLHSSPTLFSKDDNNVPADVDPPVDILSVADGGQDATMENDVKAPMSGTSAASPFAMSRRRCWDKSPSNARRGALAFDDGTSGET